jgi:ABC-2 type transport system ATP-binding protein
MAEGAALSIRNLRVDYGDFTAVDDLSLDVPGGEIFGLAGPNGAGKTSTIRVLATLLEPTYGDVEVAGHDLFDSAQEVHRLLGYMPDLAPVVPDLKVWEFLDLYAHSHGLRGSERRDRVDACLARVRLGDKRNLYGRALSRGMTQRVVLAKTLLHEPQLLLLDEPASGMDPIARRDLRVILESLAADGATIVISSHILSELSEMCSSVGVMHLGRLVRQGPLKQVLAGLAGDRTRIELEVAGDPDGATAILETITEAGELRREGMRLSFDYAGDAAARSALLRTLIERGVAVSAFTPRETGIESLLMDVVGGTEA